MVPWLFISGRIGVGCVGSRIRQERNGTVARTHKRVPDVGRVAVEAGGFAEVVDGTQ
jgi:hypothetical protein